jgi:hypothetical protein
LLLCFAWLGLVYLVFLCFLYFLSFFVNLILVDLNDSIDTQILNPSLPVFPRTPPPPHNNTHTVLKNSSLLAITRISALLGLSGKTSIYLLPRKPLLGSFLLATVSLIHTCPNSIKFFCFFLSNFLTKFLSFHRYHTVFQGYEVHGN